MLFRIPLFSDINDGLKSWFQKLQEPFYPDKSLFPKYYLQSQYTATYSRDKDYLFDDNDPKFFSLATRSRIIEFLLKRKRFTEDPNDDFSFGIGKLISDGTVLACYPLHDGTKHTIVSVGLVMSRLSHAHNLSRVLRGSCSMTSGLRLVNFGNINPWTPSETTTGSRWVSTLLGWVSSFAIFSLHAVYFCTILLLGFYTSMLIPPSIVGIVCFLYGLR